MILAPSILLINLLGFSLFFSIYCPISLTYFFTSSLIVSLLYLSGWANLIHTTSISLFFVGFFLLLLFFILQKQSLHRLKQFLLHPATIFFIFMYVLMAYVFKHATLINWDEFAFWGPFAKHYFLTHRFILSNDYLDNSGYPPASSLFQYYFTSHMGFSEYVLYLAHGTFFISGLAVLFHSLNLKKWLACLLTLLTVYFITFIPNDNGFHSLYVDSALGITSAALLLSYYYIVTANSRFFFFLIPGFIMLPLIQDTGGPLALLLIGIILIDQLARHAFQQHIVKIFCLFVAAVFSLLSWRYHVNYSHLDASKIFDPNFSVLRSVALLLGIHTDAYHQEVLHQFLTGLISVPISGNIPGSLLNHLIAMIIHHQNTRVILSASTLFWFLLLTFLSFFIYQYTKIKKEVLPILILIPLGFIAFILALLFIFLTVMTPGEAINLASFDRYIAIYLMFWILVVFGMQLKVYTDSQKYITLFLLFILPFVCIISLPGAAVKFFLVKEENMNPLVSDIQHKLSGYHSLKTAQSIYIVWQNSSGLEARMARYLLYPIHTNTGCYNIRRSVSGNTFICEDIKAIEQLNADTYHNAVWADYDYLWAGNVSAAFFETYHFLPPNQHQSLFYKIEGEHS